jgi:hemerythrin-like domain-containing protein
MAVRCPRRHSGFRRRLHASVSLDCGQGKWQRVQPESAHPLGQLILQEDHSMTTISNFLATDHKHCDDLFAAAESAISRSDWEYATPKFRHFGEAMLHHFAMEEEVMFPAFETSTGMTQGPTAVMRSEHVQMTDLIHRISGAITRKDSNACLGDADTLLILMQQHNIKEEQMLYQMADRALANELDEVVGSMRALA